jgi:hypothetical protein
MNKHITNAQLSVGTNFDHLNADTRSGNRKNDTWEKERLLRAIREASRAAHRFRDAAYQQNCAGQYELAKQASAQKTRLYELKDRGIAAAYRQELLRYAGQSPQGMAVYEYGMGGTSSFHSCLHPAGVPRPLVQGHPVTLFVAGQEPNCPVKAAASNPWSTEIPNCLVKAAASNPRSAEKPGSKVFCSRCGGRGHEFVNCRQTEQQEAERLLTQLPAPGDDFERSERPAYKRSMATKGRAVSALPAQCFNETQIVE